MPVPNKIKLWHYYWKRGYRRIKQADTAPAVGAGVVSLSLYKPWGESNGTAGTKLTDYAFTGQRDDETIGLYFYNARWYDPYITHFSQPDSIISDPYNPLDWNRYSYVRNNPIRYTDSSGNRIDDGCRTEGCSGDSDAEVHTVLSGSYNVIGPSEPNDDVPESSPNPTTNPIVRGLNILSVVENYIKELFPPTSKNNVTTFISYEVGSDGTLTDFNLTIWNGSAEPITISWAEFTKSRWDQNNPYLNDAFSCPYCKECGKTTVKDPSFFNNLGVIHPNSKGTIPILKNSVVGIPPFSGNLTIKISIYAGYPNLYNEVSWLVPSIVIGGNPFWKPSLY